MLDDNLTYPDLALFFLEPETVEYSDGLLRLGIECRPESNVVYLDDYRRRQ